MLKLKFVTIFKFDLKSILVSASFLGASFSITAQDFTEGYQYLETGKFEKATDYFENALEEYPQNKTAQLCYARALGLSSDPEKAQSIFEELLIQYPDDYELELNLAESFMWQKKFETADSIYKYLSEKDSNNFVARLGLANASTNLKNHELAVASINIALEISPDNPSALTSKKYICLAYADHLKGKNEKQKAISYFQEALSIDSTFTNAQKTLNLLKRQLKHSFTSETKYAFDKGNNLSLNTHNAFHFVHNEKHTSTLNTEFRSAWNSELSENINKANSFSFGIGHLWQPLAKLKLNAGANLYTFNDLNGKQQFDLQITSSARYEFSKWQQAEIGFKRTNFNYNAELIYSKISSNDLLLTHHIYSPIKIGWYIQYISSFQSDQNRRDLIYSALYYNFLEVPVLKVGFTINWFQYQEQKPTLYFSPEKFSNYAIFAQFHNLDNPFDKFRYHALYSLGTQKIENNDRQLTQLMDLKLGYDISNHYLLMLSYVYSNAAQENIAGFSFHQLGLQLRVIF